MINKFKTYAHRGGAGYYVENTLAAFEHAIELGCEGAELDVQLTKDGKVVVHHNAALNHKYTRKTDGEWITSDQQIPINQLTLDEIKQYTIGEPNPDGNYRKNYPQLLPVESQQIPTLKEVIQLAKENSDSFRLLIEIKTDIFSNDTENWLPLVKAVLEVVEQEGFEDRAEYCSFDWRSLIFIKNQQPTIKTWFTTHPFDWLVDTEVEKISLACNQAQLQKLRSAFATGQAPWYAGFQPASIYKFPEAIQQAGGDVWFSYWSSLDNELITKAQKYSLTVAGWSVNLNRPQDYKKINSLNLDAQCIDYPNYKFIEVSPELQKRLALADKARTEQNWLEAQTQFELLLKEYNENSPVETYWKLAIAERMLKKHIASQNTIDKGLARFPNQLNLLIERAALENRLEEWQASSSTWTKAYKLSTSFSSLNYERYAKSLEASQLWFEHRKITLEGLSKHPKSVKLIEARYVSNTIFDVLGCDEEKINIAIVFSRAHNNYYTKSTIEFIDNIARSKLNNTIEINLDDFKNIIINSDSNELSSYINKIPVKELSSVRYFYIWLRWSLHQRGNKKHKFAIDMLRNVLTNNSIAKLLYKELNWITGSSINSPVDIVIVVLEVSISAKENPVPIIEKYIKKLTVHEDIEALREIYTLCDMSSEYKAYTHYMSTIKTIALGKIHNLVEVNNKKHLVRRISSSNTDSFKVLIIASFLHPDKSSTHFNVLNNLASILNNEDNVDVSLALSGEQSIYTPLGWIRAHSLKKEKNIIESWLKITGDLNKIFIGAAQSKGKDVGKLQKVCEFISKINPNIIVFVGNIYESKIVRRLTYHRYPIAYVAMASQDDPNSHFDGVVSRNGFFSEKMIMQYGHDKSINVVPPFFKPYLVDSEFKDELKNTSDQFILATPLQQFRIEQCFLKMDQSDINFLTSMFHKHNNIKWILVGHSNFEKVLDRWPEIKKLNKENRILHLDYINEFVGFIRKIDVIFVMPKMTGGNQSVCTAMFEGVPAIVSNYCDSYGVVPQSSVYSTTKDATDLISKMITDINFRKKVISDCTQAIQDASPSNVASKWVNALKHISAFGSVRLNSKNQHD